jgi:hypothetical protein
MAWAIDRMGRSLIVDAGKQLGRPRIDHALEKRIQSQLRAGNGILKVAAECGVGSSTVQRMKREMEDSRTPQTAASRGLLAWLSGSHP